jgi:hypothetical protein
MKKNYIYITLCHGDRCVVVLGIASDVHLTTWEHLGAACDLLGASSGTTAAAAGPMVCSPAMFRLQRLQSEAAETQCVEGTASLCTALYRALVRVRLTPGEPPWCCVSFSTLPSPSVDAIATPPPPPTHTHPTPTPHPPHTHPTHTYIHTRPPDVALSQCQRRQGPSWSPGLRVQRDLAVHHHQCAISSGGKHVLPVCWLPPTLQRPRAR